MLIRQWVVACFACFAFAAGANAQSGVAEHNHAGHDHAEHDHDGHDHAEHDHAAHDHATQKDNEVPVADPALGPHGGLLQQVGVLQMETLVELGGLRLFVYDSQGQPLDLRAARGLAILQIKNDSKRYRYDLFAEIGEDQSAESLAVAVDLSKIAGAEVQLDFQLVGVPGIKKGAVKFATNMMVPMTESQLIAAAIAAQKVCPVSGQSLESMGGAIPVTVDGKTVYVCCAGCINAVKADPEKYFAEKVVLTVAPATDADAAAVALQKVCPVMGGPLDGMGGPIKVTGLERDVYLCCKGCLKPLEENPEKYLAMLPPLPESAKPAVIKVTEADATFVAAQKLCPVMDGPLDGMGGPYRTVINGRVVYLCCPGCAKKLHAEPEKYLAILREQGVSPPEAK